VGARASFNSRRTSNPDSATTFCQLGSSSCDLGNVDAEYAMASAEAAMAAAAAVAALPVGSRSRLASFGVSQDAIMSSVASGGLVSAGSMAGCISSSNLLASSSSIGRTNSMTVGANGTASRSTGSLAGGRTSSGGAAAAAGGNSSSSSSNSGDYRYSELIFRLQQFLPALKAADGSGPAGDFESTWELIKVCEGFLDGIQQQGVKPAVVHGGCLLPSSPQTVTSLTVLTAQPAVVNEMGALEASSPAAGGSCGEPMPPSSVVTMSRCLLACLLHAVDAILAQRKHSFMCRLFSTTWVGRHAFGLAVLCGYLWV
jgi:hypothetical protein